MYTCTFKYDCIYIYTYAHTHIPVVLERVGKHQSEVRLPRSSACILLGLELHPHRADAQHTCQKKPTFVKRDSYKRLDYTKRDQSKRLTRGWVLLRASYAPCFEAQYTCQKGLIYLSKESHKRDLYLRKMTYTRVLHAVACGLLRLEVHVHHIFDMRKVCRSIAVCCSVLHYVAVWCSMLQCVAGVTVCCSMLQCEIEHCTEVPHVGHKRPISIKKDLQACPFSRHIC